MDWMENFDGRKGPMNCNLSPDASPLDYFMLIFPQDQFDDIRRWTEKRAEGINNSKRRREKRLMWSALSLSEIKAFFGSLYLIGIMRLPNIQSYWLANTRLFSFPGIRDIFSHQRFKDIFGNLYLRDPDLEETDKFSKIQSLVTTIISNSQFFYRPDQYISVDESMIAF